MATDESNSPDTDERLDEIQDDIDEVRDRVAKNPGMTVPDPDIDPVMGEDAEVNPPI